MEKNYRLPLLRQKSDIPAIIAVRAVKRRIGCHFVLTYIIRAWKMTASI